MNVEGPTWVSRFFINVDQILDKIPLVSTLTNLVDLVVKGILHARYADPSQPTSHYFRYIMTKDAGYCAKLLIPGINIYVEKQMTPYQQGKHYEKMGDKKSALAAYEKGDEQKDALACYEMYLRHFSGTRGAYQSNEEAYTWLAKAAAYGNSTAGAELARIWQKASEHEKECVTKELLPILQNSTRGTPEMKQTLDEIGLKDQRLLQEAADKGDKEAQYKLGKFYLSKNMYQAGEKYLTLAGNQGNYLATCELNWHRWEHESGEAEQKAKQWFEKEAKKENAHAKYYLGRILDKPGSCDKACEMLVAAAKGGDIDAKWYLAMRGGYEVEEIIKEMTPELLKGAPAKGHEEDQINLAIRILDSERDPYTRNRKTDSETLASCEKILRAAVKEGGDKAKVVLGVYLLNKKDASVQAEGANLLKGVSLISDLVAQFELGKYQFEHGKNEEILKEVAVKVVKQSDAWYRLDPEILYKCASFLANRPNVSGWDQSWVLLHYLAVVRGHTESLDFLTKAAADGNEEAKKCL